MMRLTDIRENKASWIKSSTWPQKLKTNKKTKRLMSKNSELCEAFITQLLN